MNLPLLLSSLTGIVVSLLFILSQVELWQRKEYRLDRLLSWLRSPELKNAFWPYNMTAVLAAGLSWILYFFALSTFATWAAYAALFLFVLHHAIRIYHRGVFRPAPTLKALTCIVSAIIGNLLCLWILWSSITLSPLVWVTVLLVLPLTTASAVAIVNIPFELEKRHIIRQAASLRVSLANLTVIGITGSWGKTSTKHFLSQLLHHAGLAVLATSEHRNAALPVAQDILRSLNSSHRFFVVEMGAYRHGEIKAVAALTKPTLGIITAIGNQHIDLFGSRDAILSAKWELIDALPQTGQAILNADDEKLVQKAKSFKGAITWYSLSKPSDVYATNIAIEPTRITCELHIKNETSIVVLPLVSEAQLLSVIAATAAAATAGIAAQKLFAVLPKLKGFAETMEIKPGKNGSTIIDDSYSANEAGVEVALRHLERFPHKDRRVVLLPLIELGAEAEAVHERVGTLLGALDSAHVYITSHAHKQALLRGWRKASRSANEPAFIHNPSRLAHHLQENLTKETVILLEGRIPAVVRQAVLA